MVRRQIFDSADLSEEEDSEYVNEEEDPNSYSNQSEYDYMSEMEELSYDYSTQSEYEDRNETEESPVSYSNQNHNENVNFLSLWWSRLMSIEEMIENEGTAENGILNSTLEPYSMEHSIQSILSLEGFSLEGAEIFLRVNRSILFGVIIFCLHFIRHWSNYLLLTLLGLNGIFAYRSFLKEIAKENNMNSSTIGNRVVLSLLVLSLSYYFGDIRNIYKINNYQSFGSILSRILFLDGFMQTLCLVVKMLVSDNSLSFRIKRKLFCAIEHSFLIMRMIENTPLWFKYIRSFSIPFVSKPLSYFYLSMKILILYNEINRVYRMIRYIYNYPLIFGRFVPLNNLEDTTCSICFGELNHPLQLRCGHTFCEECALRWFDTGRSCPLCRHEVPYKYYWIHAKGTPVCFCMWFLVV